MLFFTQKELKKKALYLPLLSCASIVLKQVNRALESLEPQRKRCTATAKWFSTTEHYCDLFCKVIHQTQQRIFEQSPIASTDKVLSIFEPHVDIIIKGARDVQYGHKVNLATDTNGLITHLSILAGNPADKILYQTVLDAHQILFDELPHTTIADGGYASAENSEVARAKGVSRAAFHKRAGLSYHAMGVKKKTLKKLRTFRAGIKGNISELKRAFGLSRAKWKKHDVSKAFVWSSVLAYNLVRVTRLTTA